jgi:hypothetical protein
MLGEQQPGKRVPVFLRYLVQGSHPVRLESVLVKVKMPPPFPAFQLHAGPGLGHHKIHAGLRQTAISSDSPAQTVQKCIKLVRRSQPAFLLLGTDLV